MALDCECTEFVPQELVDPQIEPTLTITLRASNQLHLEYLLRLLNTTEMGTEEYERIVDIFQRFHRWRVFNATNGNGG